MLFVQQNTVKTANQNSRINFYFVTDFYSLYDICMVDMKDMLDCYSMNIMIFADCIPRIFKYLWIVFRKYLKILGIADINSYLCIIIRNV